QNHCVSPTSLRHSAHGFAGVRLGGVNCQVEAEAMSHCKPRRIQIGSNHPCPYPFRQSRKYQTYWPLTYHQHGFAGFKVKGLYTFDAGIHGLDKACLLKTNAVRDAYRTLFDDPVHHPDIFGESSPGGLESGRTANFLVGGALGEGLVAAVIAFMAGDMMKHNHPLADGEPGHACADFRDYARSLVPKNT